MRPVRFAASARTPAARFGAGAAMLLLGGCATFSQDGGIGVVTTAVQERTGAATRIVRTDEDATAVRAFVAERLSAALTPDAAVQIALVNNAGLQARYADLGVAEAELVQAGRLPNPRFSFSHARVKRHPRNRAQVHRRRGGRADDAADNKTRA